jgi:hypothetical protein
MKKKITILGMLFATLLIEFPVSGFAGTRGPGVATFETKEGNQVMIATGQPGRRRRRRVMRNGRWVWIAYAPNRRYRMVRRYYYVGGVRRPRMVRVYY